MLEETVDNADHTDPLGDARQAGPQAARAPNDEVDVHARLGRAIQRVDDRDFHQRIHLDDDPRRLTGLRVLALAVDELDHALAQLDRRHDQLAPASRP